MSDGVHGAPEAIDWVSIGGMLKATPSEEGGRRFLYMEASNEGLDQQGEIVAAKALADSSDYFLRYGNIDVDHYTRIGARLGIPDYSHYEIGQPVEVAQRSGATFVKAEVYTGEGDACARANEVWKSLTEVRPPQRWYPSVGGPLMAKQTTVDPVTKAPKTVLTKVRWCNIGLSKTPVNQHVPACAAVPIGVFAKCMTAGGLDMIELGKALTAEGGTDSATLTGGAALRRQSLDAPPSYFAVREHLSSALMTKAVGQHARDLAKHAATTFGLSQDEAAEHVERFLGGLRKDLQQRKAA